MICLARRRVGEVGHARNGKIAVIGHRKAEAFEKRQQAGRAKRRRSHQGATLGRAHIDGRAEHRD